MALPFASPELSRDKFIAERGISGAVRGAYGNRAQRSQTEFNFHGSLFN
jgi:hypothetical protein